MCVCVCVCVYKCMHVCTHCLVFHICMMYVATGCEMYPIVENIGRVMKFAVWQFSDNFQI